ncbi:hypothetical protein Tco_0486496 [Tanacetum coccineum]
MIPPFRHPIVLWCIWRFVGIKRLLDDLRVTATKVCVTDAKQKYPTREVSTNGQQVLVSEACCFKKLVFRAGACGVFGAAPPHFSFGWLEDMDQDSAHMVAASKVHMLKPAVRKEICVRMTATKKEEPKGLLKQQYENFTAPSSEMLDQTFDRLQKLVYKPEVKGMSSSSSSTQNMAFVSTSNNNNTSTNRAVSTAQAVNTANEVSTASTQVNAANIELFSNAIICIP